MGFWLQFASYDIMEFFLVQRYYDSTDKMLGQLWSIGYNREVGPNSFN